MKQSLGLRTGQALTMTPALQQAIRLLQLSTLDLKQEIQQALDSNVMLELDEDAPAEAPEAPGGEAPEGNGEDRETVDLADVSVHGDDAIPEDMPVDADWSDIYDTAPGSERSGEDDDDLAEFRRANLRESETLLEHLR